jgi:hypothetical protein
MPYAPKLEQQGKREMKWYIVPNDKFPKEVWASLYTIGPIADIRAYIIFIHYKETIHPILYKFCTPINALEIEKEIIPTHVSSFLRS